MTENIANRGEYEGTPIATFEEYRTACDSIDQFRKVGIQNKETYDSLVNNPVAMMVSTNMGLMPLLAPIGLEKMYHKPRCEEILNRESVWLLALPAEILNQCMPDDYKINLPRDIAVIIEDFSDDQASFRSLTHYLTGDFVKKDFINDDLLNFSGHETAWMGAYSVVPGSDLGNRKFTSGLEFADDIVETWINERQADGLETEPDEQSSGVFYFSNEALDKRPDIVDGLWEVSSYGFGNKLGKDHPLSMEFNRESFDQQITAESAMTAVYFNNGEPLCFSFISPNFSESDWLNCNSRVLKGFLGEAAHNGRVPLHWHELISKGERGMNYADKVLQEFMKLAAKSGYDFQVFFESTNLSSLYIPDIVRNQINKTEGLIMRSDVRQIGKLNYYALLT